MYHENRKEAQVCCKNKVLHYLRLLVLFTLFGYLTFLKHKKMKKVWWFHPSLKAYSSFKPIVIVYYLHDKRKQGRKLLKSQICFLFFVRKETVIVQKSLYTDSMVGTGILPNNMRFPSPECYTTFWMMTTYSDTLHWLDITPIFDHYWSGPYYRIWLFT